MTRTLGIHPPSRLGSLLRGNPNELTDWVQGRAIAPVNLCLVTIVAGAGAYGAAMGCWRSPVQAAFVGLKFPLILLLTTSGTALLNAMLAPLLGLNIGLRQSLLAVLMSFAIAAAILGSFSPLVGFMVWNAPEMTSNLALSGGTYNAILLLHVLIIAFAGVAANLRLYQFLRRVSPAKSVALRVLFAWLAANLFVGAQLSWILRPFIGSPTLPVQFLRPDAFHGNFYETVFRALRHTLSL